MTKARIGTSLLVATMLVGAEPAARAAGEGTEALIRRAVEARKTGDDEGALRLLRQAYEGDRSAHVAGQLGLCEQALGQWAEAETHIITALKSETDPWVRKNRAVLSDDLNVIKSHLARVEIRGAPAGAQVVVDGRPVGTLPLAEPLRVAAGDVEVEISSPGFATARKTVHVDASQYERVSLFLERATATPPAATAPPTAATTDAATAEPAPAGEAAPRRAWRPAYKWIAWGAGAAGLVLGVYGAAENLSLVHKFEDDGCYVKGDQGVNASGSPTTTCASDKSDYEGKSHLAIGAFITAGVLIGAGVALWVSEPRPTQLGWTTCLPFATAELAPAVSCALTF